MRKSLSVDISVSLQKRILAGRFFVWTYLVTETPLRAAGFVEVLARLASIHTPSCPAAAADKEITLTLIGFVFKRGTLKRARRRLRHPLIRLSSITRWLDFTYYGSGCVERSLAVYKVLPCVWVFKHGPVKAGTSVFATSCKSWEPWRLASRRFYLAALSADSRLSGPSARPVVIIRQSTSGALLSHPKGTLVNVWMFSM